MLSSAALQTELWTSWASLLRSYAAAHGLNASQHAVVEVSRESITLRVGAHWLHFTHTEVQGTQVPQQAFRLNEDGTASVANGANEEMDLLAERFARDLLAASQA